MADIRRMDEIMPKEDLEYCAEYEMGLNSFMDRIKNKTYAGVEWDLKKIKSYKDVLNTHMLYNKCTDVLVEEHKKIIAEANAMMKKYENAKTKRAADKYLEEYKQLLACANNVKEEFNYYDKKRLAIVEKAKECDKVLDKVELELKKDKSLNNVSKASKPRR